MCRAKPHVLCGEPPDKPGIPSARAGDATGRGVYTSDNLVREMLYPLYFPRLILSLVDAFGCRCAVEGLLRRLAAPAATAP